MFLLIIRIVGLACAILSAVMGFCRHDLSAGLGWTCASILFIGSILDNIRQQEDINEL